MYGKVFESIYEGTLYGHWEAIVTMQQLVVLADSEGAVDMTPQAIAARTSIPLEIITKGLKTLSEPDPYSRTPGDEGRRIVLLDEDRPWGWRLVNHGKYKRLRNLEEKREADRQRQAEKRSKNSDVAIGSQKVAKVAYADADTKAKNTPPPPSGGFLRFWAAWPKSVRKGEKGECWQRWRKSDFDEIADQIISHVESMKKTHDWTKESGRFIPAPRVYLSGRRWEGAELPLEESNQRRAVV